MPMLAAIIAVVMEVPAAILIVLGFFTRPLAVLFYFLHAGYGGDWSPLLGYDRRCGWAKYD
ncbi:inner membrane protein [Escherichia coli]|uniref:Inner membrane protein n=1 Tax=Escherichia coli TaxID=562 RepID=A0A376SDB9_ECOLX|nr:inner membrane protein [Escherichia coli]